MSICRPGTRRHTRLVVPACLAVLLTGGLTALPGASAAPGETSAAPSGNVTGKVTASRAEARAALTDARAVLSGTAPARTDATMTLLRLWQLRGELTGADRAAADRLLARPDATQDACTADNCYHWVTTGPDAVPTGDLDGDGVPDYVQDVMDVVDGVRDTYVGAGYRAPKTDGVLGGDARTDIYLVDVGDEDLYGYCTSDAPDPTGSGPWDAWAFCVVDNDYDPRQFPTNTPLENLQVTAAHEYFHAVQFGYDALEDHWLMEATATWAEDELYDDVNDNLQYLSESPLRKPGQPLDTFNDAGAQYGTWIFFRFLTEGLTGEQGGMPTFVRDVWARADGAAGGPDDYSMQAIDHVLTDRGVELPDVFSLFAATNRVPASYYDEAVANRYPVAAPAGTYKLTKSRKASGWKTATVPHLASLTARFVPGTGLSSSAWKLKVGLNLPPRTTDTNAVVTVVMKSGSSSFSFVPLNAKGDGTLRTAFGSSGVRYVEVTLVNTGTRYDCWTGGDYSCSGSSLDDGRKLLVRATAVR